MQYGYFDDRNREYVITNPATPAPWANYLGSPAYGALISNNAGGYSSCATSSTASISPGATSTSGTMKAGTTGLPPGSRWARI